MRCFRLFALERGSKRVHNLFQYDLLANTEVIKLHTYIWKSPTYTEDSTEDSEDSEDSAGLREISIPRGYIYS